MRLLELFAEEELGEEGSGIGAESKEGRVEGSAWTEVGDCPEALGSLIFVLDRVRLGVGY